MYPNQKLPRTIYNVWYNDMKNLFFEIRYPEKLNPTYIFFSGYEFVLAIQ